jgi:hypothetical protein
MSDEDEVRWILYVRADHRTGTISALAGVFATRGVNFDALATGQAAEGTGLVTIAFSANERRQRMLTRSVERLAVVHSVLVRRADDLGVRAAAVVHLPPGREFVPPAHAGVRWSGQTHRGEPLLVEGSLVDVELVVEAALAAGAIAHALVVQPPNVR